MLQSVSQLSTQNSRVFLADAANIEALSPFLESSELDYIKKMLEKEATSVILPRLENFVAVEFIKYKNEAHINTEAARKAGAARLATVKYYKSETVGIQDLTDKNLADAYAEGLALSNYQFIKYFKDAEKKKSSLSKIEVVADAKSIEHLNIAIEATFIARDLVNEPLTYLTADQLGEEFKKLGAKAGFNVEVFGKAKIESLKMGGLLGVNRGSQNPPTFSVMEYKPENATNEKPIVLVGKGVVFDTGGLSLKPTPNSMDQMKCDMGGAAVVGASIYAVAAAKLPVWLIALVPATDNRPGEDACVPGDVLVISDGTTVEVLNTDAEGRLILADALHYAKRYEPQLVIDFATLTGAAAAAIGPQGTVVMGTASEEVKNALKNSGNAVYERLVEFPLWDEYGEFNKSDIADIKNIGGPIGGAITAGKFLQHFTDYPWMHFDIAGPAFVTAPNGYITKGGTGTGVRTIFEFLKKTVVQ